MHCKVMVKIIFSWEQKKETINLNWKHSYNSLFPLLNATINERIFRYRQAIPVRLESLTETNEWRVLVKSSCLQLLQTLTRFQHCEFLSESVVKHPGHPIQARKCQEVLHCYQLIQQALPRWKATHFLPETSLQEPVLWSLLQYIWSYLWHLQ